VREVGGRDAEEVRSLSFVWALERLGRRGREGGRVAPPCVSFLLLGVLLFWISKEQGPRNTHAMHQRTSSALVTEHTNDSYYAMTHSVSKALIFLRPTSERMMGLPPYRRPPGGKLTEAQWQHNSAVAWHRAVVENVFAGKSFSIILQRLDGDGDHCSNIASL